MDTTITEAARALRLAIEKKLAAELAQEQARLNRRSYEESILFGFPDKDAEKKYGSSEAARKAQTRIDNPAPYNAHKDAQAAFITASADLDIARVNFYERFALAMAAAPVLEGVLA